MAMDPTLLGTIEDVTGTTIRIQLAESTASGLSFIQGQSYRVGQVGGFVRIPLGFTNLYGIISQVGASAVPERLSAADPHGNRWLTVQLVGEGYPGRGFDRGISQYPTVGDTAHVVTDVDLRTIYRRPRDPRYVQVGHLVVCPRNDLTPLSVADNTAKPADCRAPIGGRCVARAEAEVSNCSSDTPLAAAEAIPALVDIDLMVSRHSAVVGTTGSGKSTTVVGLLAALSDMSRYPSARILIIDIHGEYGHALSDRAAIFRTMPDKARGERPLYIPYWAMTLEELLPLTLGGVEGSDRGAVVDRITDLKQKSLKETPRKGVSLDSLTVDTPVPFSLHQLWFDLHCEMHATHRVNPGQPQSRQTWALQTDEGGNLVEPGDVMQCRPPRFRSVKDVRDDPEKIRLSTSRLNIGRAVDGLGSKLRDPRLSFLFRPGPYLPQPNGTVEEDLDRLLASWLGDEKPVTILDLSGASPAIQSELVGTLLRLVYDALFWARNLPEGGRERPLLVVLEEAHTYLGGDRRGSASSAIQRIAKEGRKYGIGIMLVSQRPSEIDSTILSQCGTMFALRLTNDADRNHVRTSASDGLEGIFAMLPVLRTGEAIVVGEAVNRPIRTLIDRPSARRRPDSADPVVVVAGSDDEGYETPGGWNQKRDPSDYAEVVELWRKQDPHPGRVVAASKKSDGEEGS